MASYTITINERTNAGKSLLQYLSSLGVLMDQIKPKRKTGVERALDDVKAGRVYHADSVDDMFKQILGDSYVQGWLHQTIYEGGMMDVGNVISSQIGYWYGNKMTQN